VSHVFRAVHVNVNKKGKKVKLLLTFKAGIFIALTQPPGHQGIQSALREDVEKYLLT